LSTIASYNLPFSNIILEQIIGEVTCVLPVAPTGGVGCSQLIVLVMLDPLCGATVCCTQQRQYYGVVRFDGSQNTGREETKEGEKGLSEDLTRTE